MFLRYCVFILVVLILTTGCPKDSPLPIQIQTGLEIVELDTIWVRGSNHMNQVSVRITPVEQSVDREMRCFITGGLSSMHFRLYDDGNFGRWIDSEGFTDTLSGDQVPGDGIFSRRVSSAFTSRDGTYLFTFAASDSPPPDTVEATVTVRLNSPPVILSYEAPDSIYSGGADLDFSAVVLDAEGSDDITEVEMFLIPMGHSASADTIHPFSRIDDTTWSWKSRPEIAVGMTTRYYLTSARAADRYLAQIQDWSYSDTTIIWLENLPPGITSVEGPDTIWIPPDDTTTIFFEYSIAVIDDQGIADQHHLHLQMERPDQSIWENDYFDDGEYPDTSAVDGVFTAGFSVNNQNETGVTYYLNWMPIDRASQQGEVVRTPLTFMSGEPRLSAGLASGRISAITQKNHDEPFNLRVID